MKTRIFFAGMSLALVGLLGPAMGQDQRFSLGQVAGLPSYSSSDGVVLVQDPRLGHLVARHVELNEAREGVTGYRVQIYYGSGQNARMEAEQTKELFERRHPFMSSYVSFQSPFWKVMAGDFRKKNDALVFRKQILEHYSNSWVVESEVDYTKIE